MCVAMLLQSKEQTKLIHWAARLASAKNVPLLLIWARKQRGKSEITPCLDIDTVPRPLAGCAEDLAENGFFFPPEAESDGPAAEVDEPPLAVFSLLAEKIHHEALKLIEEQGVTTLVLPRSADLRPGSAEAEPLDYLSTHVHCEVVLLTPGERESGNCREILSPVGEGPHSISCLRLAHELVSAGSAKLITLHVEPEIDETAPVAAANILARTVDRALGSSHENVAQRVELADNVVDGIHRAVGDKTDLIVLGIKRAGFSKRYSSAGVAGKIISANLGPTVAIVQSATPMASRLGRKCDELLQDWVPQLARERRIELVERVQRSSRWDFDFILLICLSTVIAATGLIQDSAAVVIGAMLVAPLMTPLLGAGLAMVQGNHVLFRNTLLTVLRGFLLAYGVAVIVIILAAWIVPVNLTDQMRARGEPSPLDILVAMVGGVAAAYASGRPNLLSALPGVAIAAALVPPIATSGMALWLLDFELARNSALLFATNIVAIILGTALTFRATGIRSAHQHSNFDRWSLTAGGVLLILTILLGIVESMPATEDGQPLEEIVNQLAEQDSWRCTAIDWENSDDQRWLTVRLVSGKAMTQAQLDRIQAAIDREFTESEKAKVKFVTEVAAD